MTFFWSAVALSFKSLPEKLLGHKNQPISELNKRTWTLFEVVTLSMLIVCWLRSLTRSWAESASLSEFLALLWRSYSLIMISSASFRVSLELLDCSLANQKLICASTEIRQCWYHSKRIRKMWTFDLNWQEGDLAQFSSPINAQCTDLSPFPLPRPHHLHSLASASSVVHSSALPLKLAALIWSRTLLESWMAVSMLAILIPS